MAAAALAKDQATRAKPQPARAVTSTCTPLANLASSALSQPSDTGAWMTTHRPSASGRSGSGCRPAPGRCRYARSPAAVLRRPVGSRRRWTAAWLLHPPEDGGFQPRLAPRCRFAVHRPGSPVASPRSHGMPCRGFVLGSACARLDIANIFDFIIMRREGEAFLPRPEGRGLVAAICGGLLDAEVKPVPHDGGAHPGRQGGERGEDLAAGQAVRGRLRAARAPRGVRLRAARRRPGRRTSSMWALTTIRQT
jgi:hypothetical protein